MIYSGEPAKVYGSGLKGICYFIIDALGMAYLFETPSLVGTWWYMSLAFTLIVVLPILIKIYNQIGFIYMMILFSLLSRQLALTDSTLIKWLPATLLGIWFADKNLLVKIKEYKILSNPTANKCIKFVIELFLLFACYRFRQSGLANTLFELKDGVIPVIIIIFLYEFIKPIKFVNTALEFIGKYSMDIFLIHTVIRANCFRQFTYSFKYPIVIVAVLLVISLIIAIILETLKKLCKYDSLTDRIQRLPISK